MEALRVRPPFGGDVPKDFNLMIVDVIPTTSTELIRLARDGKHPVIHLKRNKAEKKMTDKGNVQMILFGCTEEGHSAAVVTNYSPYVDVMVPHTLGALCPGAQGTISPDKLFKEIEEEVLAKREKAVLSYTIRQAWTVFGFNGKQKKRWLRISTSNAETFSVLMRVLRSKGLVNTLIQKSGNEKKKYVKTLTLAFDKLGHDERFCSEKEIAPSGWVHVQSTRPLPSGTSMFTTQIQCFGGVVEVVKGKTEIAPLVTVSFDIESVPEHATNFPKSSETNDVIAQIGVTIAVHGQGIVRRCVICLGNTATPKTEADIIILSCSTETEVLQYLRNIITDSQIDCDVITGYNIFDFDFAYCADRAIRIEAFGQVAIHEAYDAWRSAMDVAREYKEFKRRHDADPPKTWNDKKEAAARSRMILSQWVGYTDDGGNRFANMPHAMKMLLDYDGDSLKTAYDAFHTMYDARFSYNYCSRIRAERTNLETIVLQSAAMGSNEMLRFDMRGRTSFDLFMHIKNGFKMSSYKLNDACAKFLPGKTSKVELDFVLEAGSTKTELAEVTVCEDMVDGKPTKDYGKIVSISIPERNDGWPEHETYRLVGAFKHEEVHVTVENGKVVAVEPPVSKGWEIRNPYYTMFYLYLSGNAEKRGLVAEYCSMDCDLVCMIIDQAAILVDLIEMSRFTYTPLPQLVTRGQQVKVYRQIAYYCNAWGYALNHENIPPPSYYEGATVLPPKSRYYMDPICTLDFQSLYPGIMRSHNFCFSTYVLPHLVPAHKRRGIRLDRYVVAGEEHHFVSGKVFQGLLPRLLAELHGERRSVKKQMKNVEYGSPAYFLLNAKQLAIKVTMNSVYGFCGVKSGKMPCYPISATTTKVGRDMIQESKAFAEKHYDCEVIYGDTDSIMTKFNTFPNEKIPSMNMTVEQTDERTKFRIALPAGFVESEDAVVYRVKYGPKHNTRELELEDVSIENGHLIGYCSDPIPTEDSVAPWTPMLLRVNGVVKTVRIDDLARSLVFLKRRDGRETCEVSDSIETMTSNGWVSVHRIIRHATDKTLFRIFTTKGTIDVTEDHSLILKNGDVISPKEVRRGQSLLPSKLILSVPENRERIPPYRISDNGKVITLRASSEIARLMAASLSNLADERLIFYTSAGTHGGVYDAVKALHGDLTWHESVHIITGIGESAKALRRFYQKEAPLFPLKLLNSQFKSHQLEFVNHLTLPMKVGDPCLALAIRALIKIATRRCTNCIFHEGFYLLDYGATEAIEVLHVEEFDGKKVDHVYDLTVPGKEQFDAFGVSVHNTTSIFDAPFTLSRNFVIHPTMEGAWRAFDAGVHCADAITDILYEKHPAKILEMEKVISGALYFPTKKCYAQRCFEEKHGKAKFDCKGLPIVRRDNAQWMRGTLEKAVKACLPKKYEDPYPLEVAIAKFREEIQKGLDALVAREVPLSQFLITKSLRMFEDYKSPASMGHVVLWRRILDRIEKNQIVRAPPRAGDRIAFAVVEGSGKQFDRCEDLDWIRQHRLKIDREYYAEKLFTPSEKTINVFGFSIKPIFDKMKTTIRHQSTGVQQLTKFFSRAESSSSSSEEAQLVKKKAKKKS